MLCVRALHSAAAVEPAWRLRVLSKSRARATGRAANLARPLPQLAVGGAGGGARDVRGVFVFAARDASGHPSSTPQRSSNSSFQTSTRNSNGSRRTDTSRRRSSSTLLNQTVALYRKHALVEVGCGVQQLHLQLRLHADLPACLPDASRACLPA